MAVRRLPPPADVSQKMLDRSAQATAAWETGVQNPSKSPTGEMKKAGKRYDNAIQESVREQRWQKATGGLTDEEIFAAARNAGGGTWAHGISSRADKIKRAYDLLLPKLERHLADIDALPTDTPEQRTQKMVKNLEGMRKLGNK